MTDDVIKNPDALKKMDNYSEQLYTHKFNNLDMGRLLEHYKVPNFKLKEIILQKGIIL